MFVYDYDQGIFRTDDLYQNRSHRNGHVTIGKIFTKFFGWAPIFIQFTELLETLNTDSPVSSKHIVIIFFSKCAKIVANFEEKDLLHSGSVIFRPWFLKMDTVVVEKLKTGSVQGYANVQDKQMIYVRKLWLKAFLSFMITYS